MNHNISQTYQLEVTEDAVGNRLDKFIVANIADLSRSRIKNLIEAGHLTSESRIIKDCSLAVKLGVIYFLDVPEPESSHLQPKEADFDIVYEDDSLLVINKPAGLTVHPGAGNHQDTLVNALIHHCGSNLSGIGGILRPGIVHRLDKDTSGLMVVAKDDFSHQHLSNQLSTRTLSRIYTAIVWGVPMPMSGAIKANIARSCKDRTKMTVVKQGGKEAITHFKTKEVLGTKQIASLVECKLETGRTHQIRVHFSHQGNSLVGDQTYGNNNRRNKIVKVSIARQALHAKRIGFIHPRTEQFVEFDCPVPTDIAQVIEELRL